MVCARGGSIHFTFDTGYEQEDQNARRRKEGNRTINTANEDADSPHGQSRARDPVQVGLIYCRRPALRGPGSRVGLLLIPTESQPTILPHSPTPVSSSFRLPMTLVVRLWLPCIFCHINTTTRPRTPQFRGRPCRKSRHMICTDTPIHSLSLVSTLHVTPPKNARVNSP